VPCPATLAPMFLTPTVAAPKCSSVSATDHNDHLILTDREVPERHNCILRFKGLAGELVGLRNTEHVMLALHHFDQSGIKTGCLQPSQARSTVTQSTDGLRVLCQSVE